MPADPKRSAGARVEREAFRRHLRRQLSIHGLNGPEGRALHAVLTFVLTRKQRYDRATGGLGKQ